MPTQLHPELMFDPEEAVAALSRVDKELARIIRRAGPFTMRPEKMHSPFLSLLRAIVYQQLSGKAAATIYARVDALFPGRGNMTPAEILAAPEASLRGAGMSRAKVLAVKDLA